MDLWKRVRHRFVDDLENQLKSLEISFKSSQGRWLSITCPFCDDSGKNPSAGIHRDSCMIKCHQCSYSAPLFDWYAKRKHLKDAWTACKQLAQLYGIETKKRKGRAPANLDQQELETSVLELWDSPEAQQVRDELARRGFTQGMLEPYCIGFKNGAATFPIIEPNGRVMPRPHMWWPPKQWGWGGKPGNNPNYFWPLHLPPDKDKTILICEGEMDTLTAREHMPWAEIGAYCWTGGAHSPLIPARVPDWMKKREVLICYDNDVWQGGLDIYACPGGNAIAAARSRLENLLEKVARVLWQYKCNVTLLQVPIDPVEHYGADIRDCWNRKITNLDEFPRTKFEDVKKQITYHDMKLENAYYLKDKWVRFKGRVSGDISELQMQIPDRTQILCSLGQLKCCESCQVPLNFPEGLIDWTLHEPELAKCLASNTTFNDALKRSMLGVPKSCPRCEFEHLIDEKAPGLAKVWLIQGADSQFEGMVIHRGQGDTPYGEEVEIEGQVIHQWEGPIPFVVAQGLKRLERDGYEISEQTLAQLEATCPGNTDDITTIDNHLYFERGEDLSYHVTKIYQRESWHIFYDLAAHSALRYMADGRLRRGWIDCCIVGPTREGKSDVIRSLWEHYGGLGEIVSVQSNWSLAGLVMGNEHAPGRRSRYRTKAGCFPRNHGKIIVLDEAHTMQQSKRDADVKLMAILQEIRDRGLAQSVKIGGSKVLPSAVRLIMVANPVPGGIEPCEQLIKLYQTPESLARMDYAIVDLRKMDPGSRTPSAKPKQIWTSELCHALMRRAWNMTPEQIHITEKAMQAAYETIDYWGKWMSEDLPLYTGHDKIYSLLRTAISVANLVMSHPKGKLLECEVRPVHVKWARAWIHSTWEQNGYITYCERNFRKGKLLDPVKAEWLFVKECPTGAHAMSVLRHFLDGVSRSDTQTLLGIEGQYVDERLHSMIAMRQLYMGAPSGDRRGGTQFRVTTEGERLLRKILHIAEHEPDFYAKRWMELKNKAATAEYASMEPLLEDYGK